MCRELKREGLQCYFYISSGAFCETFLMYLCKKKSLRDFIVQHILYILGNKRQTVMMLVLNSVQIINFINKMLKC